MYTTLELAFIRKENILRVASRINFLEEKAELQILFALITLKHHEQGSTDFIRVADWRNSFIRVATVSERIQVWIWKQQTLFLFSKLEITTLRLQRPSFFFSIPSAQFALWRGSSASGLENVKEESIMKRKIHKSNRFNYTKTTTCIPRYTLRLLSIRTADRDGAFLLLLYFNPLYVVIYGEEIPSTPLSW